MLSSQLNQAPALAPPSSLQSALQMDPNHHPHLQLQQQQQQQQQQPPPAPPPNNKRRKKADSGGDDMQSSSEPRRLRRSHEACARCRSKKIKCDSKHPRCTACATAGTACHQEDRHRQTLTPRGHTERIEHQVAQCEALLKRHIPGFELDKLDEICAREGIDVGSVTPPTPTPGFQFQQPTAPNAFRPGPPPHPQPGYYPPPHMMAPHPYSMIPPYPPPFHPMSGPPGYNPHIHPSFQVPPPGFPPPQQMMHHPQAPPQTPPQPQPQPQPTQPALTAHPARVDSTAKGIDPNGNDMSNTEALAKNFGVSAAIVSDLKLGPAPVDREDLAVGSSGLSSGRDRDILETTAPREVANWIAVTVRRNSNASGTTPNTLSLNGPLSSAPSVNIWLPKDRKMIQHIVDGYFVRLNLHRPVFERKDFEKILNDLYDGHTVSHDPGYICSVYLVLALGTLSELNHRAVKADVENKADLLGHLGSSVAKKLMPHDWPEHDEFFERALSVKPDLRVTISSLQALILLHWYLYTEASFPFRQGRTLWRLVGSLVRLSIELGLHHDPTTQMNPTTHQNIFTMEESQLRIRLWGIVLVHDRGTSILLGRPLGIAPSDFNTPRPTRPNHTRIADFSEHFEHSHPVAEIQADIINSLYAPKRQSGDVIMRNATRIIKHMLDFRRSMPDKYKFYFSGTNDWALDKKSQLVQDITEDEGLTLLKIGISRILLLRALFSSKELTYAQRHRALVDAIITSHNTIIVHNQLIRFPDIAFFTSPIPLHIAAMVILYGHMSKCDILPRHTALQDVWLALDMLPRFRWRWERKDFNGGHPLIAKLAERVMEVNLQQVGPVTHPSLLCEPEWDEDIAMSPVPKSQQSTPTLSASGYPNGTMYGPQPRSMNGNANGNGVGNAGSTSGGSTPPDGQLMDVPTQLFYPFYPETQAVFSIPPPAPGGTSASAPGREYRHLLEAAAAAQDNSYGCQSSQDSYMSEERDPQQGQQQQGLQMWMSVQGQSGRGGMPPYQAVPPQA
ncbi:hypothetical protein BDZ94DRAFT_1212491 [Collybia nuda]|uniref:Zn(2)-C6 fungal-type domain-containing protein n=1 Tax=Collybia nuda TaxID=64659 RepID=A0A9P6CLM8_9AGAR|nr:hypothetical protein BDZ94DRAFT_1212491 [Collybia nuda]